MTQHIFIDVEALGPPGIGNPFALGAVVFDATGIHSRHQWHIDVGDFATTQGDTLAWLSRQPPEVLAQLRDGKPFAAVWQEFLALVRGVEPIFWADDFSDFAWLDREARVLCLTPIRALGSQYDSSAIQVDDHFLQSGRLRAFPGFAFRRGRRVEGGIAPGARPVAADHGPAPLTRAGRNQPSTARKCRQ